MKGAQSQEQFVARLVEIKPSSYQPTKAELEADVSIPTTPERLARCITRQVTVRVVKK